jgi:transglutaminase-like putative cysteine protease
MLFSISHRTKLDYSQPISESVMEVRALPRNDARQVLRQFDITVTPNAKATHHVDWLGNTVHQFSVLGVHEQVIIASKCIVETRPVTQSLSELGAPLEGLTRDHRSWDFLQHEGPVNDDPNLPAIAARIGLDSVRRVGEAIDVVVHRTGELLEYRRGATSSSSTVSDALKLGAGVCQDFAHLGLALLRRVGVPCRYVSGYLYRDGAPELETHAWAEAFVPGVGWLAFDPTHGVLVSEPYVTVAVGRSYADVPPNRGVYRGEAKEQIDVGVVMQQLEERARLTPYSTALERPLKVPASRPTVVPIRVSLGLEQQLARPNSAGAVVQQQRQQQQ